MEFYKKYKHVGYSYPTVPNGWKTLVENAIIEIENVMWVRWIPLFIKRWIHYLATGNSVYHVKYRLFYKLRQKLTKGQIITDIKEKYAGLRIYAYSSDEIDEIIEKVTKECDNTCQECGCKNNVSLIYKGWYYNLCIDCKKNYK